ncbi:TM2 domain-containing protein [Paeniglutamicibacter antarcticus]|uniref:TM2 domain-containing protein n=1 Tax=Arthrobacter terrae TaxID=2935737 RepID=A0A931CM10_9MICC|nr:TM2 domain-containing protein [Arthrobacter terrae]MBG0738945.1 TM2 domain-containing protein [Arthrobacter terrae]
MTLTLGTDQPFTGFITDDFESLEITGQVPAQAGLELPYLDFDDACVTGSTHPQIGFPPPAPLVPADRFSTDNPPVPVQLKRDRLALRAEVNNDLSHTGPAPGNELVVAFPTRRSLRLAREAAAAEEQVPDIWVDDDMDPLELSAEMEAALLAAMDESLKPEGPSTRSQLLAWAEELAAREDAGVLMDSPFEVGGSELMITSYGPFPVPLPAPRDFRPVLALSVFAGFFGADRFYLGKPVTGLFKLATAGGAGIWWIADIITILRGRTCDKDGRHVTGAKKHRAMAWALTMALFAGLTVTAANAATPVVTAATDTIQETFFPKPVPVRTWATLADIKGTTAPAVLQVTGDRLRLTYNFPGPAYAYLQKDSDTTAQAVSLLLKDAAAQGTTEISVIPGTYRLVIRTDGTDWTTKVEELGLHS